MKAKSAGAVISAVLLTVAVFDVHGGYGRTSQTQQSKAAAPSADNDKSRTSGPGCSMLTPVMLEKVLGQPFNSPSESSMWPAYGGAWGSSCQYHSKKPASQGGVRVDLLVYVEASAAEAKETFDKAAVFFRDNSKLPPSIGDSAYWQTTNKGATIHILKGKAHYSLSLQPANESQLKDLATAVAARL